MHIQSFIYLGLLISSVSLNNCLARGRVFKRETGPIDWTWALVCTGWAFFHQANPSSPSFFFFWPFEYKSSVHSDHEIVIKVIPDNLTEGPLYVMGHLFSFAKLFSNVLECVSEFIFPGVHWAFWRFIVTYFIKFGNLIIVLTNILPPLSLLPLGSPQCGRWFRW